MDLFIQGVVASATLFAVLSPAVLLVVLLVFTFRRGTPERAKRRALRS